MDRSRHNRGVVDKVFGFCSDDERRHVFHQVPDFERMPADNGSHLFKFWLNVGRAGQSRRCLARERDPLKPWKLRRIDAEGLARWEDDTTAIGGR